ncbi:hypothetical protein M405DRAFT_44688 [Rhizopogon salebrosus TDB-379]|nr:hypothetical protein M405DRAFT_44688 [Rhizopogon salebrosus TDB-379]
MPSHNVSFTNTHTPIDGVGLNSGKPKSPSSSTNPCHHKYKHTAGNMQYDIAMQLRPNPTGVRPTCATLRLSALRAIADEQGQQTPVCLHLMAGGCLVVAWNPYIDRDICRSPFPTIAQHISGCNAVRGAERRGGDVDNRAQPTENFDRGVHCGLTDSLRSGKAYWYGQRDVVSTPPVKVS